MTDFLFKSTISLLVFLSFYHLVLEREKMHQFNRFYLLFSLVISFAIPFFTFEIIKEIPVQEANLALVPQMEAIIPIPVEAKYNYTPLLLWSLYGLITLLLAFRFGKNIWKLISKSITNPAVKHQNAQLILVSEKTLPHTFLNSIFINYDDYNSRNIEEELYTHELVHVNQKHTLDILFIEFLKVIFWFNPIFIFYKKAIQLNHEFLADEEIVKTYNNVPFYQNLLLQKGNGNPTIYLASNLNYLVTKKRLIMMTKSTSKKMALVKKIAAVPVFCGLVFSFCIETIAQEKIIPSQEHSNTNSKTEIINSKKEIDTTKKKSDIQKPSQKIISENSTKIEDEEIIPKPSSSNEVNQLDEYNPGTKKNGYIYMNKSAYFFVKDDDGIIEYYNRWGFRVNEKGERLDKIATQKQGPGNFTINGETFFYSYNDDGTKEYYNKQGFKVNEKGEKINNLNPNIDLIANTKNPEFPGGITKFYEFIANNYKMPENAKKNTINGMLYLSFTVEEDGSLSDFKLLKDLKFGTGEEAIRVLKTSPKWIPGEVDGKKTRTSFSLPMKIKS